jgi:hypothetical protein
LTEPVTGSADGSPSATGDGTSSPIGWWRAVASALVILAVGALLFVYGPNWVMTKLTGLGRGGRVAIATTGFFVLIGVAAWSLRRRQARRVI